MIYMEEVFMDKSRKISPQLSYRIILGMTMMLIMGVFLTQFVSSAFATVSYQDVYKVNPATSLSERQAYPKAIISDWFGLFGTSMEVEIVEHDTSCIISCTDKIKVTLSDDLQNPLGELKFRNSKLDYIEVSKNSMMEVLTTTEINDVIDYETICSLQPNPDTKNATKVDVCEQREKGTHKEEKNITITSSYSPLKTYRAGTYYFTITANKKPTEQLDWVISPMGKDLERMAWWNATFTYKKLITITNNNASTIANESVWLFIPFVTSKMNPKFIDVKFADATETIQLNAYQQNYTDSINSTWAVLIPSLAGGTTTDIYMYYGNTSKTTLSSSWDNTFVVRKNESMTNWAWANGGSARMSQQGIKMNATQPIYIIGVSKDSSSNQDDKFYLGTMTPNITGAGILASASFSGLGAVLTTPYLLDVNVVYYLTSNYSGGARTSRYSTSNSPPNTFPYPVSRMDMWHIAGWGNDGQLDATFGTYSFANVTHTIVTIPAPTYSIGAEQLSASPITISPTLIAPANLTNVSSSTYYFSSNGTTSNANFSNATLYIYNGGTYTQTTSIFGVFNSTNLSRSGLTDGNYTWAYEYCAVNSTSSLCSSTENRTFTVDISKPIININYPLNANYSTNVTALNFTTTDAHGDRCWYSLNGTTNSTSVNYLTNWTGLTSEEGWNNWTLWCNDTFGNINQTSVYFFKDTVFPIVVFDDTVTLADGTLRGVNNFPIQIIPAESNSKNTSFFYNLVRADYTPIEVFHNATGLADGFYLYNVTLCDIVGNCNSTETRNITIDTISPVVRLNSPIDATIITSPSVIFSCNATSNPLTNLSNVSLWTNMTGSWQRTETINIFGSSTNLTFNSSFTPILNGGFELGDATYWSIDNQATVSSGDPASVGKDGTYYGSTKIGGDGDVGTFISDNFTITGDIRVNYAQGLAVGSNAQTGGGIDFECNGVIEINFSSSNNQVIPMDTYLFRTACIKVFDSGAGVGEWTEFDDVRMNNSGFSKTITQNTLWTCEACDLIGTCHFANENRTILVDTTYPRFTLNSLANISTVSLPVNASLDVTTTDTSGNLETCWYITSDNATKTIYNCNNTQNVSFLTGGSKTITVYANDTFNHVNSTIYPVTIWDFEVTQSGSATAGEGSSQTFTLTINSTSFPIGDGDAVLWYNGISYTTPTKLVLDANSIKFTKVIVIPSGTGNSTGYPIDWLWSFNTTYSPNGNTSTQTQTVTSIDINDCEISGGVVILNITAKDEEFNVPLIENNYTNSVELDLSIISLINSSITWDFSKTWTNNNSIAVCIPSGIINSSNYTIDFTIGFEGSNHVREFYYMENGTLDNTDMFNSYTNHTINLMDLLTADSTTFLFEYTDEDGLEVDDIIVHTFRKYIGEGLFREVERSKQDTNGQTHVHLVEEDVIYYFMITQGGRILYISDTYNAKCLSTPCEISLSASATDINWSIIDNEGGKYLLSTDKTTRVITVDFSLESSSLVNATVYRFADGNTTVVNSSSLTAMSGSLPMHVPLSYDNSTFFVAVFKDNKFIKSEWTDLRPNAKDVFGITGALFGGLIVLALVLMSISEGVGLIIFTILAVVIVAIMSLVDLGWMAIVSIICAGGIIIWKLIKRRKVQI